MERTPFMTSLPIDQPKLYCDAASAYFSLTSSGREANVLESRRSFSRRAGKTAGRSWSKVRVRHGRSAISSRTRLTGGQSVPWMTTIPSESGSLPNPFEILSLSSVGRSTRSLYEMSLTVRERGRPKAERGW